MKILYFTALLSIAPFFIQSLSADVGAFETKEVDQHSFTSPDKTAVLSVSLERIDRAKIRQVDVGENKVSEAWLGKRQLPSDVFDLFILTQDRR